MWLLLLNVTFSPNPGTISAIDLTSLKVINDANEMLDVFRIMEKNLFA